MMDGKLIFFVAFGGITVYPKAFLADGAGHSGTKCDGWEAWLR
jgi:hypothetical protein